MAEALLNQLSNGRLQGLSAGSRPTGKVHPVALTCLQRNRTPVDRPRSKSWDEFEEGLCVWGDNVSGNKTYS